MTIVSGRKSLFPCKNKEGQPAGENANSIGYKIHEFRMPGDGKQSLSYFN